MDIVVESINSKLKINATTPTSNPDSFTTKDNVLTISHRNVQDDKPAAFNDTLRQQGMGDYVDALYTQGSDRWSNPGQVYRSGSRLIIGVVSFRTRFTRSYVSFVCKLTQGTHIAIFISITSITSTV